jgi:hypothetical protein
MHKTCIRRCEYIKILIYQGRNPGVERVSRQEKPGAREKNFKKESAVQGEIGPLL